MNKNPIIKIVVLNIFILSFVFGVFYSIYDFLNNLKETRYYVQKIDYDISMMNTNLYQSYLSKQMIFLVSSARNSLDIKASLDELSKLG